MTADHYVVASIKPWNQEIFNKKISHYKGQWHLITTPDNLTFEALNELRPKFIFFPHWSWKVPDNIISSFECVGFHETDLPYGRGGSPIQNLIERNHKTTKISAIKLTPEMDAGPIYMKADLDLKGTAEAILTRAADIIADMILLIINGKYTLKNQEGDVVIFKRRQPSQSEITQNIENIEKLHDFIRMLDAPGYPKAFISHNKFKIEFTKSTLEDGILSAKVEIRPCGEEAGK